MYNAKVIEYPNESVQIRQYSKVVGVEAEKDDLKNNNYDVEPFTNKRVKVVENFEDEETREKENQRKSLARTKSQISTYARCYEWEMFVTLTFNPKETERTDFKLCMKRVRNFLKNAKSRLANNLKYLAVPELHADGKSWHVHILMADTGDIVFTDSGKRKNGMIIYNLTGWKWGYSTASIIKDTYRVQHYIVKYMNKQTFAHAQHAHRYYVSNNLPKPKVSLFLLEEEEKAEFVQNIADSMGKEIVFSKTKYSDYTDVTYIELQ